MDTVGFLAVNNRSMTVLPKLVIEKQPSLTLSHLTLLYYTKRRPNLMYTVDYTFSYHSQKFIHACMKSSAHAHRAKIRDGYVKLFKTSVGCAR